MQPIPFFHHAFLRHAPWRYAIMLGPEEAQRFGQHYLERRGRVTNAMIRQHLAGQQTLAVPVSDGEYAHLLPLEIEAGGLPAIQGLLAAAARLGLWGFGQYCPQEDWPTHQQRGNVWLPFAANMPAAQLQQLGARLIGSLPQPVLVASNAHTTVSRLPLGRHTHTGQFGQLVIGDQIVAIDPAPLGTLTLLAQLYHENPATALVTTSV